MKRLAWLFLAVFCTALAQVQPVELQATNAYSCPCCEIPGACGMPDCGLPPSPASASFFSQAPARISFPVARRSASSDLRYLYTCASLFSRTPLDAASLDTRSSALALLAAPVPLFEAHCSFLI